MKKVILNLILCVMFLISNALASVLDNSYKIFSYDADTIFLNSISALNSNSSFEIAEIQSKNGNILFLYQNKFYLLTVTKRYQKQTEVKILPQNSDYSDSGETAKMVFSLIEYQLKFNKTGQIK